MIRIVLPANEGSELELHERSKRNQWLQKLIGLTFWLNDRCSMRDFSLRHYRECRSFMHTIFLDDNNRAI